jgi:hypothetical protein
MQPNRNPHIINLLSWHGHAAGGVHVPFQARANPLGHVIETSLVLRLRELAAKICADPTSRPRWVFLVGGPGNGKSETVQDFLTHLDISLGGNGDLVNVLTQQFSRPGLLPRKVEILPSHLGPTASEFAAKVGRLVVVQDATATEDAQGDAARELAFDLADLFTLSSTPPMPVFVACANRGLLARAMHMAFEDFGNNNEVTRLLANVIQASSLGHETLVRQKSCWPLETDERFACWPLDVESLLRGGPAPVALDVLLSRAVDETQWETIGRCEDCSSHAYCPFRQSAEWLRDNETRGKLLAFLRHGELARGQRWNFRDAFSLVAELLVGQWSDFEPLLHPCDWVHSMLDPATVTPLDPGSVLSLAMHLYPHALFRGAVPKQIAATFAERRASNPQSQPLTQELLKSFAAFGGRASIKPIRETLARDYVRLDPASTTPTDPTQMLRLVEDAFCQSVEQGRDRFQQANPSSAEDRLLELLQRAEEEWNLLGRESATAIAAVCLLRKIAGMIAKRSAGIRLGYHALDDLLADYEASLRDPARLAAVRTTLQPLLGSPGSRFNLLEILGQPTADKEPLVSLRRQDPGIRILPAPAATASAPGHDMPCVEVAGSGYRIPLTFDFYMALRLRKEGCAGSSLPAIVRAALDRVRHRYAGQLCRMETGFVNGTIYIQIPINQKIEIPAPGAMPTLTKD